MSTILEKSMFWIRGKITGMAIACALGYLVPLHAQESDRSVRDARRSDDQTGRPITRKHDLASMESRWQAQQIATRRAEADYQIARLSREVAELAILEYVEVLFPQALASANAEIKMAESSAKGIEDEIDRARKMPWRWGEPPKGGEDLYLKKARFTLDQALSNKKVLVEFTKRKRIQELKGELDQARSMELAKRSTWEMQEAKEVELERLVIQSRMVVASR